MNKTIIAVFVVIVVVLGGYFIFRGAGQQPAQQLAVEPEAQAVGEKIISYTDAGYSPTTVIIKKGEAIVFKNQSSRSMWPASAMHPTHSVYPTTGGCIGSTFDACKGVLPGESWLFKFDIVGSWKYHDHLSTEYFGTIAVE